MVADPVPLESPLVVAGSGHAGVGGDPDHEPAAAPVAGILHRHPPGTAVPAPAQGPHVAQEVDDGRGHTLLPKDAGDAVRRVLLPHATQVQFHARPPQGDRAVAQPDRAGIHQGQEGLQLCGGGHPGRLEVPRPAQCAHRGIEAAPGGPVQLQGRPDEVLRLAVDGHRLPPCLPVDLRHHALGPVAGEPGLDAPGLRHGGAGGPLGPRRAPVVGEAEQGLAAHEGEPRGVEDPFPGGRQYCHFSPTVKVVVFTSAADVAGPEKLAEAVPRVPPARGRIGSWPCWIW